MAVDSVEARLGDVVKLGLPLATLVSAGAAGATFGLGPAIMVLAGGMLGGAIVLAWTSLRFLGEDEEGANLGGWQHTRKETGAHETKLALLRTLKDLEHERDVGKLSASDYETLSAKYRSQLKAVLREMDEAIAPFMAEAEARAAAYLASHGRAAVVSAKSGVKDGVEPEAKRAVARRMCGACKESNEPDAAFCKKCGQRLGAAEAHDAS